MAKNVCPRMTMWWFWVKNFHNKYPYIKLKIYLDTADSVLLENSFQCVTEKLPVLKSTKMFKFDMVDLTFVV